MPLLPLDEARAFVLAGCPVLPTVSVALSDALGAVAIDACVASEAVPPFANTAMDGFAVRSGDVSAATETRPVRLRIAGTLRAGMAPDAPVGAGEALRIMTGAPLPPGADAVVMVERTVVVGDTEVDVLDAVPPGNHVRPAGDDLRPGDEVFPAGTTLGPGHLGLLATVGATEVRVARRPRVGVLSTGDELVAAGQPLGPGQIRDSNRLMLLALVAESGYEGVDLGLIRDDEDAITEGIERGARDCDALISSGGVSMGDFDFVKVVLDRIGDMRWMQIAIRPAKPLAFGTVAPPGDPTQRVPVFGLPGNPVSSLVSFELFARPGLRQMAGHGPRDLDRPRVTGLADEALARRTDGKTHVARVVATFEPDGLYHVRSAGRQGSHQLAAMARANALAVLPDGPGVGPGDPVDVLLLR